MKQLITTSTSADQKPTRSTVASTPPKSEQTHAEKSDETEDESDNYAPFCKKLQAAITREWVNLDSWTSENFPNESKVNSFVERMEKERLLRRRDGNVGPFQGPPESISGKLWKEYLSLWFC